MLAAIQQDGSVSPGLRSALAVEAFRHTAAYDARIAETLPARMAEAGVALPDEPGLPGASDPYPASLTIALEKVESLRYGENPHQPAARYRRPGNGPNDGLFATGAQPLQGKALSYNNVLDAAAASALGRSLRGPAVVIVKHTNPCGAAERPTLLEAWSAALAADPVSAFGGVVALTRPVDRPMAEALVSIFLEVVVAPGFDAPALAILAAKPNLRILIDIGLALDEPGPAPDPLGSIRSVGGAGPGHGSRQRARRPGELGGGDRARPDRRRAARSRSGLAAGQGGDLERDRAGQGPTPGGDGFRADVSGRCRPRGRRQGPDPPRPGMRCAVPLARRMRSTRSRTRSRSAWLPG